MRIRQDLWDLVLATGCLLRLARAHPCGRVHGQKLLCVERWWGHGSWLLFGWFRHRPHVHGNGPVRLDHSLPNLRQDDLAIRPDEIIMALVDVGTDDVDVEKRLFDKLLHTLDYVSFTVHVRIT